MPNASQRNVEAPTKTSNAKVNAINAARVADIKSGKSAYSGGGAKGQIGDSLNSAPPTIIPSSAGSLDTTKPPKTPKAPTPLTPPSTTNPNGINTAEPTTGKAPPPPAGATDGLLSYDQAQQKLNDSGLSGNALAQGQAIMDSKYGKAHQDLVNSGAPVSSNPGEGASAVADATKPYNEPDSTQAMAQVSTNPAIDGIFKQITELQNSQQNSTTLVEDAKQLRKDSGLDSINAQMIDAETVLNGTEQDIRNEIQTAGGFGTESQIQALTLSRNKGLLTKYNQLVQMKSDATNQLNTMLQLNAQDKQMAQSNINNRISTLFSEANIVQSMQNAATSQAQWAVQAMGADGLYNSLKGDPQRLANTEKLLGLGSGGMSSLASQAAQQRALKTQSDQLDISYKKAQIAKANYDMSGAGGSELDQAVTKQNALQNAGDVQTINSNYETIRAAASSVGKTPETLTVEDIKKMSDPTQIGIGKAIARIQNPDITRTSGGQSSNALDESGFVPSLLHGISQSIPQFLGGNFGRNYNPDKVLEGIKTANEIVNQRGGITETPKLLSPQEIPSGYYQASDGLLYPQ